LVKKKKEDICIQNKNRRDNCQSDEEKWKLANWTNEWTRCWAEGFPTSSYGLVSARIMLDLGQCFPKR
jgi:hypothetical protein